MVTAAEIAREIGNDTDLKRKARVVAFTDLPGVPEGTPGKVTLVNGWGPWVRYRVLFDNRVDLGSINRGDLALAKHYEALAGRRSDAFASGAFERAEVADPDAGAGSETAGDEAEAASVNGVAVPGHLLERSKAARARLTG